MNIKDLNILERLLPSQNLSKELTLKQVDAGFVQIYEKKLEQSQNTQSTRYERQVQVSDKRMTKGKMNQSTREIDGLDSRENAAERATKGQKRKSIHQGVSKAYDAGDQKESDITTELSENNVVTQASQSQALKPQGVAGVESEELDAVEANDIIALTSEMMNELMTAIKQMSTDFSALQSQIASSGETHTPALESVLTKIETALAELQNALSQNMNPEAQQTEPLVQLETSIKQIKAFQQEIKALLNELPEQHQMQVLVKAQENNSEHRGTKAYPLNVLHELRKILQAPVQHMQLTPLLNKIKAGEEKTSEWLDQHLTKMTDGMSKLTGQPVKQVSSPAMIGTESLQSELDQVNNLKTDEKKPVVSLNQESLPVDVKLKPEAIEKRLVHLEQVGTPMDKQLVKMIERNQEPTHLFKSILTQVQDGVKATLKVMQDGSEMVMKLKPESLGEVSVKVTVHKNTVTAEMTVQSQIVKEALEASLFDLKNTLRDKGFDVNDIQVSINLNNSYKEQSDSREQQFQNGRYVSGLALHAEDIPTMDPIRSFIQNGRLDYFA